MKENPYEPPEAGNESEGPRPVDSRYRTFDTISWLCILLGFVIIFGGCFFSIALRNPGGTPVSADEERRARMVAYVAFGLGAALAILVPAALIVVRRFVKR